MKKVVLFVAVLMFAGAVAVSAQTPEPKLEVALAGNASFTFGLNFDAHDVNGNKILATGISNALENDTTLTILAAADYEKGGKEGEEVYGWIKLKQIQITGESDNTTTFDDTEQSSAINVTVENVEAKLFLGPVYVNVLGVSDEINTAGGLIPIFVPNTTNFTFNPAQEFAGVAVGLKDESIVSVVIGVSSLYDYADNSDDDSDTDGDQNTNYDVNAFNDYRLFGDVALKAVPGLTLEVKSYLSTNHAENQTSVGFGGKIGYEIGIAEGYSLFPYAAYDSGSTTDGDDLTYLVSQAQLAFGLNFKVPGSGLTDWDKFGDGYGNSDDDGVDIAAGLTAVYSTNSFVFSTLTTQYDPTSDLAVYFYDADLIPVLNVFVAFELSNFGNGVGFYDTNDDGEVDVNFDKNARLGWGVYAEAVLDQLKPWGYFYFTNTTAKDGTILVAENAAKLAVGVDLTVITNTTFSISYENTGLAYSSKTGLLKFTTKITY